MHKFFYWPFRILFISSIITSTFLFQCLIPIIQVERPWDLSRDSGQRSWHIPIRITAHSRGAFISVGDLTPTETNLLLLTTWRSGSLFDWDKIYFFNLNFPIIWHCDFIFIIFNFYIDIFIIEWYIIVKQKKKLKIKKLEIRKEDKPPGT